MGKPRLGHVPSLINKTAVRNYIMAQLIKQRPAWRVTQVSDKVYAKYEAALKHHILGDIMSHPSLGKTFNP